MPNCVLNRCNGLFVQTVVQKQISLTSQTDFFELTNTSLLRLQGRILHRKHVAFLQDGVDRAVQVVSRQLRNVPHQEAREEVRSTPHSSRCPSLHVALDDRLVLAQSVHDAPGNPLRRQHGQRVPPVVRVEDGRVRRTYSSHSSFLTTRTHNVHEHAGRLQQDA